MPHTKTAKKRLRQNLKRRMRNRTVKRDIKEQLKAVLAAVKEAPAEKVREELNKAAQQLDRAAAKRVIHPNLAARKKSQLARLARAKEQTAKPS
jgi:small subunit ribosomal protein S20